MGNRLKNDFYNTFFQKNQAKHFKPSIKNDLFLVGN